MTLRTQTLCGAKYRGPTCFPSIPWTRFYSRLGIDTAVTTSMTSLRHNLLLIERDYFDIPSGSMLRLKCLVCLS